MSTQSSSTLEISEQYAPVQFFKCLSDDNRLKALMLISVVEEACVCDLQHALDIDQPKLSRNLSLLRKCKVVQDHRRGKWVYYRLHPSLPNWASSIIHSTRENNIHFIDEALGRLQSSIQQACCDD